MSDPWQVQCTLELRGVHYHLRAAGRGSPLLLLHGFAGSGDTWSDVAPEFITRGFQLLAPDLLGHGASDAPTDASRYVASEQVADLLALLDTLAIERTALLGYSMGGRLALHLALTAPERVSRLVVESATPGIADPVERAARQQADEKLARAIEERGLLWFAEYWDSLPLFASRHRLPENVRRRFRAQWLTQRPHGLASSLRGFGTGTMPPVWERLQDLRCPVLIIVGALDERYVALGRAMVTQLPHGTIVIMPDAGHTVHLEQPEHFSVAVESFLRA